MISYLDACLEEIEDIRRDILTSYHSRDYESMFLAVNRLDDAVHRLNNPEED